MTLEAPYQPDKSASNYDENHVNNQGWKDADAVKENEVHLKNPTTQQLFKGYFFDKSHNPSPSTTKATTGGNNEIETEGQKDKTLNSSAGFTIKPTGKNILPPEGLKQN
jgi:hypothetical protein